MQKKNYYEIFKLYPPIDENHLRDVYKQLIFEYHPDRNPERMDWAVEHTMEIVEAYNVLSDPERRDVYNFQIRIDIRKEPGENIGVKKALLKVGKSSDEIQGEAHFHKGNAFFEEKDTWNQAQHEWNQSLKYLPGLANAWYNLGVLFGYQGNFKDSLSCLNRVIKMCPQDAEAKKAQNMAMSYVYGKRV